MKMRSTKSLIAAIMGVAMLAMPITAAAAEHHRDAVHVARAAAFAPRSFRVRNSTPARSFAATRAFAPRAFANDRFARSSNWRQYRAYNAGNGVVTPVYPSYGYSNPLPVPAVGYLAPAPAVGYADPNYGSPCVAAQRAIKIAHHDRRTGHPAAANDVLRNNSRALASCPQANSLTAYNAYGLPQQAYPYSYGTGSVVAPLLQNLIR
jgi:hypothetical protein